MKLSIKKNSSNRINTTIKSLKFNSLFIAKIGYIFLALVLFSSCSKDDPEEKIIEKELIAPTLTLESGSTDTLLGVVGSPLAGSLQYTIKATAPNGFNKLVIEKLIDGDANEYETIDTTHPSYVAGSNTFTYNLNYILSKADADKNITFRAMILDDENFADNLTFAKAETKMPMLFSYLAMRTDNPPSAADNFPYYVYADNSVLKKETIGGMKNSTLDENVIAVLSWNDGSGLYFASPNITIETQLTDDLSSKSVTKFKKQNISSEQFYNYDVYDAHEIDALYNGASFNSHEEKAEAVNIGKTYSFLTESGKTGLMFVKDLELIGSTFYVDVDVFFAR